MDADENSTAADPMGGQRKYNYVQSNMPAPDEGDAVIGGGFGGGLGSAMGGGEFDLNQGPTNLDRPAPLTDEVPF